MFKIPRPHYSFLDDPLCGDYMNTDGSLVALGSTGAHGTWARLVNPHRGPTPPTEIQALTNTVKHR